MKEYFKIKSLYSVVLSLLNISKAELISQKEPSLYSVFQLMVQVICHEVEMLGSAHLLEILKSLASLVYIIVLMVLSIYVMPCSLSLHGHLLM